MDDIDADAMNLDILEHIFAEEIEAQAREELEVFLSRNIDDSMRL